MTKEFKTLSDERQIQVVNTNLARWVYPEENVKEFIKEEDKIIEDFCLNNIDEATMTARRRELAGKELIDKTPGIQVKDASDDVCENCGKKVNYKYQHMNLNQEYLCKKFKKGDEE